MSRTNKWIDQGYGIQHKNDFYFYLLVISNTIKNNIFKKSIATKFNEKICTNYVLKNRKHCLKKLMKTWRDRFAIIWIGRFDSFKMIYSFQLPYGFCTISNKILTGL